jgi:hypothetical protein
VRRGIAGGKRHIARLIDLLFCDGFGSRRVVVGLAAHAPLLLNASTQRLSTSLGAREKRHASPSPHTNGPDHAGPDHWHPRAYNANATHPCGYLGAHLPMSRETRDVPTVHNLACKKSAARPRPRSHFYPRSEDNRKSRTVLSLLRKAFIASAPISLSRAVHPASAFCTSLQELWRRSRPELPRVPKLAWLRERPAYGFQEIRGVPGSNSSSALISVSIGTGFIICGAAASAPLTAA